MEFEWTFPAAEAQLTRGVRFGAYTLGPRLGQGAMAEVFHARDDRTRREVALKVLSRWTDSHRERFAREVGFAAGLQHPHLVRVLDAGLVGERPFMALELVRGARPLTAAWANEGLQRRVSWLHDVAGALGHAHQQRIVHRDVKPENVLVDAEGVVRVSDFGVARGLDLERLTLTGAALGTPSYMSPEQLRSLPVTPATDVWALGVLLYLALCERLPFPAKDWSELAQQIEAGQPTQPRELNPAVPAELQRLCLAALAADPRQRPADGTAFAAELQRWLNQTSQSVTRDLDEAALGEAEEPRRPQPGDVVGPCKLEALLGEGGMGSVFRAQHERLGRTVAIKVLQPGASAEHLARFAREGRAAASVNHSNVAQVLDLGSDPLPFLIQELVEGQTLAERVSAQPLDPAEVARLAVQLAQGLEAIHAVGLIHRDLKPENVVCTPDGEVKIVDFGVVGLEAGLQSSARKLTAPGTVVGTPLFMAPEQTHSRRRPTPSIDLWALGATLHFALTGRAPHEQPGTNEGPVAVLLRRRSEPVPDVRELRPSAPAELCELIMQLLELEPSERPSAQDVIARLLEVRRSGRLAPPSAPSTSSGTRWALGGVIGLAFVGIGLGVALRGGAPTDPGPSNVEPDDPESPDPPPPETPDEDDSGPFADKPLELERGLVLGWRNDSSELWALRSGRAAFEAAGEGSVSWVDDGLRVDARSGETTLRFAPDLPGFTVECELRLVAGDAGRVGLLACAAEGRSYAASLSANGAVELRATHAGGAGWTQAGAAVAPWEPGASRTLGLTLGGRGATFSVDGEPCVVTPLIARRDGQLGLRVAGAEVVVTALRVLAQPLAEHDALGQASPRPADHRPRVITFARSRAEFATTTQQRPLGVGLCLRVVQDGVLFAAGRDCYAEMLGAGRDESFRERTRLQWLGSPREDRLWNSGVGLDPLGEDATDDDVFFVELGDMSWPRFRRVLVRRPQLLRATLVSANPRVLAQAREALPPKARMVYLHGTSPSAGRELISELPDGAPLGEPRALLTRLDYLTQGRVAAAQRAGWEVYALARFWGPEELAAATAWRLDGAVTLGADAPAVLAGALLARELELESALAARETLGKALQGWR